MKYVVIAEDDPEVAAILSQEIGDRLYVATHVVANGALVPESVAARRPDLLILDVALPGLSGLDVFDLVRSDPQWRGVPVLFLTASPEKAESVSARDAGAPDQPFVMAKPFDLDVLLAVVDQMVEGRPAGEGPRLAPAA